MSYSDEIKKIRKNVFCLKKLLGEKLEFPFHQ